MVSYSKKYYSKRQSTGKEFDTYKVGTTANSTSTMHKITAKPITLDCFEMDDFQDFVYGSSNNVDYSTRELAEKMCLHLEALRKKYLETGDKKYWKELIRWLPESWLQTRTVTMNYENLLSIVRQRKAHKLNEWSGKENSTVENFISFVRTLPYATQLIFEE